ncbi:hypothetical protein [Arthrobacter sp. A5]|uniref:hypothetical protein n=1 Tax=Arthrobacter sp. A5 TaxID=576926 RepID=UPI003DA9E0F6
MHLPELTDAEESSGFAAVPLIQWTTDPMTWLGDGRPVTGTGVLRLRDIAAAAESIGVAVRRSLLTSGSPSS